MALKQKKQINGETRKTKKDINLSKKKVLKIIFMLNDMRKEINL